MYDPYDDFKTVIDRIINTALREDIGDGDHSSLACIPKNATGEAFLMSKSKGVLAGVSFAKKVFEKVGGISATPLKKDGEPIEKGATIFKIIGNQQNILKAERLVLNAMQRMSGIATETKGYCDLIADTKAKVLDTRKTTPCVRALEKWAVFIGGGVNHRFGLYDAIMLKDNHIDFAGGIPTAIQKTNNYLHQTGKKLPIIVEARNLKEVKTILNSEKIDRILLDNFDTATTQKAIKMIDGKIAIESSGNITKETIRDYAIFGVDYISCGSLTHHIKSLDLSLKVCY